MAKGIVEWRPEGPRRLSKMWQYEEIKLRIRSYCCNGKRLILTSGILVVCAIKAGSRPNKSKNCAVKDGEGVREIHLSNYFTF